MWSGAAPDFLSSYVTIGGGAGNKVSEHSDHAAIGGGQGNSLCGRAATIGGGAQNLIQGVGPVGSPGSVIAGGEGNKILSNTSDGAIGGGCSNTVRGAYGTIPGGFSNSASMYGFAAGRRAIANHQGAFVWADSTDADFASTANNQFLIRAGGGVGINTSSPQAPLHVANSTTNSRGSLQQHHRCAGFACSADHLSDLATWAESAAGQLQHGGRILYS